MSTEKINLWEGWWRWPLIPVASIVGAFLGSSAFMILQLFNMKLSGQYNESGWYFQYILPLIRDGIFGFLMVYFGCLIAPRGKLIVGVVLTTLLGTIFVVLAVLSIKNIPGATGLGALSGIVAFIGGILGVIQGNDKT